jgi:sn1-specific diacylglycerol lipase
MAGIILFNRRWNISSDDFFFIGLIELILRLIWLAFQLLLYLKHGSIFMCTDSSLLNLYLIGFLTLMVIIILTQLMIVIISSKGTISNSRPRKKINAFLYTRILLIIIELIWNCIGIMWWINTKTDFKNCPKAIYFTVLANIIFCFSAIVIVLVVLFLHYDPISHLPQHDITSKRDKILDYITLLCCFCCLLKGNSRDKSYKNSYDQIGAILEFIFRGGDLTPSDISAGILLLSCKENNQFNRETRSNRNDCLVDNFTVTTPWMNINEASYYIKYAIACYSWPYYVYIKPCTGLCLVCCKKKRISCCCCCGKSKTNINIDNDNMCGCYYDAFKELSKTNDCDIVYGSFRNELFHAPFFIIHDHYKKAVIISIRGTLSIADVITDMTAECGNFDLDYIKDGKCHIGILNTAENIYKKIKNDSLLEKAFEFNQNYQLVITGHSLGAGTAAVLGLKLIKEFPNLRCFCYSPPGGLLSKNLVNITKSFVLTVILGDDIVPRLSLRSIHNLKANILKEIYESEIPKYKIVWDSTLDYLLNRKYNKSQSQDSLLINNQREDLFHVVSRVNEVCLRTDFEVVEVTENIERQNEMAVSKSEFVLKYSKNELRSALDMYEDLNMPGCILYIYDLQSNISRCYPLRKGKPLYDVRWATAEEFKNIIITRRMLIDHFPNAVHDALKYFHRDSTK